MIRPPKGTKYLAEHQVIIGNAAFYGATSGEAFIRGKAGERFCVRNSGATVVVEGIGDHGCEYMTGGTVIILGEVGKNFAAGMSGGVAYILDSYASSIRESCDPNLFKLQALQERDEEELCDVKMLLTRHVQYTGSLTAKRLLDQWDQAIAPFIRVIPKEYERLVEMTKTKYLSESR